MKNKQPKSPVARASAFWLQLARYHATAYLSRRKEWLDGDFSSPYWPTGCLEDLHSSQEFEIKMAMLQHHQRVNGRLLAEGPLAEEFAEAWARARETSEERQYRLLREENQKLRREVGGLETEVHALGGRVAKLETA